MILRRLFTVFSVAAMVAGSCGLAQQPAPRPKFDAFEVATVKPADGTKPGRYMTMQTDHRLIEVNYTLKGLIAAAYDLNPKTISGGPAWLNYDKYEIVAETPGTVRPTHDEQMTMLRALLAERFKLAFQREPKEFSIFAMELAKSGPKLQATTHADDPPTVGPGVAYPQKIVMPGRNATVGELASLLQRAILDRPVVDQTGLKARYDFDLEWAPDETQFQGDGPKTPEDTPAPNMFEAMEKQLGLKLRATRGMVNALVVTAAERPSAN